MRNRIFILALMVIPFFLLSFTISYNGIGKLKVIKCSSNRIRINDEYAIKDLLFRTTSYITFPNLISYIYAKAKTDITYIDSNNKECIWYANTINKIAPITNSKQFEVLWWLKNVDTKNKGVSISNLPDKCIMLEGDSTAFVISNKIENVYEQYYNFLILDGEHKGASFQARNDDSSPLIWFLKEDLEQVIDCSKEQSFMCQMNYISHNLTISSDTIQFHYYK